MMYQLPSGSLGETISIPTELRDSLSCLNVVWSDMFEAAEIKPDTARQQELDFLHGAPPTWLNFYTSVNLPLVERDGFNDLIQLIERKKEKSCLITDVSLRHQPGSGGSTLGMQVLWHFRKDLRCARAVDSDIDTKELSKQVLDLFLLSNKPHAKQDQKTVLLLLDTKEKRDNNMPIKNELWENLIKEIHNRDINTQTPVVIILDWNTEDFSLKDTLILGSKPSEEKITQLKEKLLQQIRLQRKSQWKVTTTDLLYDEDGGSALAREMLQDLRDEFTCETWTDPFKTDISENRDEFTREIEKMMELFRKYKKQKKPVLLLLDHSDDKPLRHLLKNLQSKLQQDQTDGPAVVIINAVRKSVVRGTGSVKLKLELLPEEKERFTQKRKEIKKKYKKMSKKFHAFNIMRKGFQKEDAEKVITGEMVNHIEKPQTSGSTQLLRFLALINSYVPGSHLSLCKKFIEQTEWLTDEGTPSWEEIMKPFMDLIVIFSDGKEEANCIRLKHPMIAEACLKFFKEENQTSLSVIALDFLNKMVEGNESDYEQICKRLLCTRPEGLTEKEMFSRLNLDIMSEGDIKNKGDIKNCTKLLERASNLFSTDPFYPQALARLYYIKVTEESKYSEAEKWAKKAIERDPKNSHVRDTLGQVHKNHLSWILNKWKKVNKTCSDIHNNTCLSIAQSAIKAFKDEEEAAEDELDDDTKFNNRGHFGFLQVCKKIYDLISQKNFINGLRGKVESKYDFFERYLTFSSPSNKTEEPEYFRRDVEDCYKQYFTQGMQTEEATLNERKQRTFAGMLHFLKSDINVRKQNLSAIEKPQSEDETQTVLYILANIILSQAGEPAEEPEELQDMLQNLWSTEAVGRSAEFYLLVLLLFWPDEAKPNPPNLGDCVQYMSQSYEKKYQKHLRGRFLVPLFFYGKGEGLQRLVHALKPHQDGLERPVHSKLLQTDLELLTEGYESVEVECLQRIDGKVENNRVFAVRNGQQIEVNPYKQANVCKQGHVSFYLGFTIRGPVAYNITYHNSEVNSSDKEDDLLVERLQKLSFCPQSQENEEEEEGMQGPIFPGTTCEKC